jgi:hypothetical protein
MHSPKLQANDNRLSSRIRESFANDIAKNRCLLWFYRAGSKVGGFAEPPGPLNLNEKRVSLKSFIAGHSRGSFANDSENCSCYRGIERNRTAEYGGIG